MARTITNNIDLNNQEFSTAWELITKTQQSVFLTGKAGTGKSTFLRYICENSKKNHIILAPTGIAAVNVGGVTLHSFFKMPLKPLLPDDPDFSPKKIKKTLRYPSEKVKIIKELDLLIIDEISMVRADMIDFIDKVLRTYSGNMREPFGGKQLLLVGDVFQLEPVITQDMREILKRYYNQFFFFNAHAFSTIHLVPIELKKIYRQNNENFISLLDKIRVNQARERDLAILNSRYIPAYNSPKDEFVITLATRRDTVDVINEQKLGELTTPEFKYEGAITGDFPTQNLPTSFDLVLKEGAQVIFIKNDKEQRWVNGTLGRVSKTTKEYVEIELENGKFHTLSLEIWENMQYTYDEKEKKINETILGTFEQYPIKPAWALTVHKSQGLTFTKVIVDFNRGAFTGGQTYVALSRCTSLEGIVLMQPLSGRDIFVNPSIIEFSNRFNDNKVIAEALERAEANGNYHDSMVAFKERNFDKSIRLFANAISLRNELNNVAVQRLIRKEFNVINRLHEEIVSLKKEIENKNNTLSSLANEYASMGKVSLSYDVVSDENVKYGTMAVKSAMANYNKALTINPYCEKALEEKGILYLNLNEYDAALESFEALLRINKNSSVANYGKGLSLAMNGQHPEALKLLKRALKCDKTNYLIHDALATVYRKIGLQDQCEKHEQLSLKYRIKKVE